MAKNFESLKLFNPTMNTIRLFGIETEYGIAREDCETADPVVESMELVRAYLDGHFARRWDYRGEHPHEDQRGFRVAELAQDKEEELFAEQDAHRPFSFHGVRQFPDPNAHGRSLGNEESRV